MKFALIGQDIPMLLPTLLADLLFAGNEGADTAVYENNPAMQGVLQGYMDAIYQKRGLGGRALVSEDLPQVLEEALRRAGVTFLDQEPGEQTPRHPITKADRTPQAAAKLCSVAWTCLST